MRALRVLATAIGVVLAAALLAACSAGGLGERVVGTWGDGTSAADPHLIFSDDGRVTGSDGCNSLSGSWRAEDDSVEVSDVAGTLMACPGVDTWLRGIAEVALSDDGERLVVTDDAGARIGTLDRAE
ncbi:META domain-containing protein [Plantibacter sp. VKM Ac-2880]|uniref:META domain-containing protein n=1 Tax=Plantibacter sp. VKM Ac-2880 TaxID=2783827 RepID=UPI00188E5C79|nr:META domain-containing protein [Plantibacter sp. VKM Ac-2880]MBF4568869.1 META domain-containing protein [Plantibacter sp. VKM Ac-2880]